MRNLLILFALCNILSFKSFAQVPTTDIYLMDMKVKHGKYIFENAQKISDFKGYNNQPYFTPDGKSIYYVSYRNKQSDIYKYDIKANQTTQFTNTPEDEYSPKLTPDGKYISVVRVMKDSSQQLWEFPLDGGNPSIILRNADSIGYYCWIDKRVAIANIPEPMKLEIADTARRGYKHVKKLDDYELDARQVKNIGRTIQKLDDKSNSIIFVLKSPDKKDSMYLICKLSENSDYSADKMERITQTLPHCEDFALGPKSNLYMGCKGKLYKFRIGYDLDWTEIADFTNTPYKSFYRLAINAKGDKICVVSYEGKKP